MRVAVIPRAPQTRVDGVHDGALRLRLKAPPIEGRANDELVAWLAGQLGVPKRCVRIARGAASRSKSLEIDLPIEQVQTWVDSQLG